MPGLTILRCSSFMLVFSALLVGADFSYNQARPLMALSAALQEKFGLLITYEDAPTDPITETASEVHSNGRTFFFPKWKPITFHVGTELQARSDAREVMDTPDNVSRALQAIEDAVNQYNNSGNPGRFRVALDGEYLHIQQTAHVVNGRLQMFEPVSNSVLKWQGKSGSCSEVLSTLKVEMAKQLNIGLADGAMPVGALLTHHCDADADLPKVGQVLAAVIKGLDASSAGERVLAYTWYLVYDPNWNKYFLSISLVGRHTATPINGTTTARPPAPERSSEGASNRTGIANPAHAPK